jgi:hypothetical protein
MKSSDRSRASLSSLYKRHAVESFKLSIIGIMSCIALFASAYIIVHIGDTGLLDVYNLIPHLYLVPFILMCLWYPRSGLRLITFITVVYFAGSTIHYIFFKNHIDFFLLYLSSGLDLALLFAVLLYAKDIRLVEAVVTEFISHQEDKLTEDPPPSYSPEQFDFDVDFEKVIASLKSEEDEVRADAVCRLAGITDKRAILPLVSALRDPAVSVRKCAARSLGRSESTTAVQPLIDALSDSDRGVRDSAAESLGHLGIHAHSSLLEALSSPQWERRVGALVALRLTDVDVDPLMIIPLLADENHYVRREATKTVGRIGGENVLGDLKYVLQDPDPGVRIRAINSIVRHADPLTVQMLLIPLLNDEDSTVRLRVQGELRKIERNFSDK